MPSLIREERWSLLEKLQKRLRWRERCPPEVSERSANKYATAEQDLDRWGHDLMGDKKLDEAILVTISTRTTYSP